MNARVTRVDGAVVIDIQDNADSIGVGVDEASVLSMDGEDHADAKDVAFATERVELFMSTRTAADIVEAVVTFLNNEEIEVNSGSCGCGNGGECGCGAKSN